MSKTMQEHLLESAQCMLDTANERYKTELPELSNEQIRIEAGIICFKASQELLKLLSMFENNFEGIFDVNEREGEDWYKVNSISIYQLLSDIDKYESLALLFGLTDDLAEEILEDL